MGMPVAPVYDLDSYRFRDSVTDPASLNTAFDGGDAAANTPYDVAPDILIRVRFLIQQTDALATTHEDLITNFVLQYNNNGVEWLDVGAEGTSVEDVVFADSANFANGDATTQIMGAGTFVAGDGMEADPTGDVTFLDDETSETEMEAAITIISGNVVDADSIALRFLYSAGDETPPATLVPTTNVPTMTVDEASVQTINVAPVTMPMVVPTPVLSPVSVSIAPAPVVVTLAIPTPVINFGPQFINVAAVVMTLVAPTPVVSPVSVSILAAPVVMTLVPVTPTMLTVIYEQVSFRFRNDDGDLGAPP